MTLAEAFHEWLPLLALLAGLGIVAGFFSGLLGIGGGIVLVPGLYYSMTVLGYNPDHLMHMAVGTSLAAMVPTGLSSARAHAKRGAVDRELLKKMGAGLVPGVGLGTLAASVLSADALRAFFACALMGLSVLMLRDPDRRPLRDSAPAPLWIALTGTVIGFISTLMGIGGATMNVPYMTTICRTPMHRAVGTAAAQGLFISIPGLLGFILLGRDAGGLPPFSLGYVNMIAWALIVPFSIAMAPLGARLAHSLPVGRLRHAFAVLMALIAARMLMGALS